MSSSTDKIGKSIDGILGNLTIRGRENKNESFEIAELKKKLLAYEALGSLEVLRKERDELIKSISRLKEEQKNYMDQIESLQRYQATLEEKIQSKIPDSFTEKNSKQGYQPSPVIRQYCEQPEGKRKLTIHLREIDYQAVLKATNYHSHKGKLMDTITNALRFYLSEQCYHEAETEVYQKALYSVRGLLEKMGFSADEIHRRIQQMT